MSRVAASESITIDLSNNSIEDMDDFEEKSLAMTSRFRQTTFCNLHGNQLRSLGPFLGAFANLKVLDLRWVRIVLICSDNLLYSITCISMLPQLETLSLADNKLTTQAIETGKLQDLLNLRNINLNGNSIKEIPPSLMEVRTLSSLGLADNLISIIPSSITKLMYLSFLSLKNNQITKIQADFTKLPMLKGLSLAGNPCISEAAIGKLPLSHISILHLSESPLNSLSSPVKEMLTSPIHAGPLEPRPEPQPDSIK
ncbi:hypothetical protein HDV03_001477 [Kappamyces sp. JEL0829]|nr:hypothetical protein HDV03_001477 [Kappamyces sp. JEL0829]